MIQFIKSATKSIEFPVSNKEIVFVGRSNVGKSSLINALYGKIAYVGKTPGKTRILNFFDVDGFYTVCDVPGYGFADRSDNELINFGNMMEDYFDNRKCLKTVVVILDIRHKPTNDDKEMIDYLKSKHVKCLIVCNKADKLSYSQCLRQVKEISGEIGIVPENIFITSCEKKTNIDKLKEEISR